MIDYKKLAGKYISSLNPYQPGKPIKEVQREMGIDKVYKMASNENPFGISEKVKKALINFLPEAHRYPIGNVYYLKMKLSDKLNISPEKLIFGAGSNEIIEFLFRTFVKKGEESLSFAPSFSVYGLIAQAIESKCNWIPTNEDFSVNFDALANAINEKTRLIFLANPNNPTGTYFNEEKLIAFLDKVPEDTIVVIDEAYVEFVDANDFPNSISLMDKYPNIVIMRTFSKAYGLASLRIGYAIGQPECIDMMNRVRQPFNINMAAQVAAEAVLDDNDFLIKTIEEVKNGKKDFYSRLDEIGLEYIPSQTNFILIKVGDGKTVFEQLMKKGVIVRFLGSGLSDYIRVDVSNQKGRDAFFQGLKEILTDRVI
jgi:histidinol-phosphate aminotransferase